jgi:hypothetical protein
MVGWPAVVLVVAVVLVIAGMVRWVVADQARTRRLVALIRAVRRP